MYNGIILKMEDINDMLIQLEKKSNKYFKITIDEFGDSPVNYCFGNFHERPNKVIVTIVNIDYIELAGEYNNVEAVKEKIKELYIRDNFTEVKPWRDNGLLIGKCNKCLSYNENVKGKNPNNIYGSCQNCHRSFDGIWKHIKLSTNTNSIYISSGGRYAKCDNIGKYDFLSL
jgi:hypothetical protein